MCRRAPPGGFSPIHPWGWFNWQPSSVTLFCICTHTVPPCPSSVFSHFKCPHITPWFHFLSSTPLPTTPSINSTKASILISLLPAPAPLDEQRKHTWEEIALHPCRKDSEAPILQIRVIAAQRIPFQSLMLKSLNGMWWWAERGLQRNISHRWRQWTGCQRI